MLRQIKLGNKKNAERNAEYTLSARGGAIVVKIYSLRPERAHNIYYWLPCGSVQFQRKLRHTMNMKILWMFLVLGINDTMRQSFYGKMMRQ